MTTVAKSHLREQLFPNARMYAVRTHKQIGSLFRTVLEVCADLSGFLGEMSERTSEMQYLRWKCVRQYLDEFGAVHRKNAVPEP